MLSPQIRYTPLSSPLNRTTPFSPVADVFRGAIPSLFIYDQRVYAELSQCIFTLYCAKLSLRTAPFSVISPTLYRLKLTFPSSYKTVILPLCSSAEKGVQSTDTINTSTKSGIKNFIFPDILILSPSLLILSF